MRRNCREEDNEMYGRPAAKDAMWQRSGKGSEVSVVAAGCMNDRQTVKLRRWEGCCFVIFDGLVGGATGVQNRNCRLDLFK